MTKDYRYQKRRILMQLAEQEARRRQDRIDKIIIAGAVIVLIVFAVFVR